MKKTLVFITALTLLFASKAAADDKKEGETDPLSGQIIIIPVSEMEQKEWTIESYRVDPGDILEISVWQVEELDKEVIVRPDGMISFPLIGDVAVAGFSLDEITKEIADKLRTYIKNPQVSVIVRDFGGKKTVILGEVASPGIIRFTEPIRILEAIALSGGLQETAGLKSVLVIRGDLRNYTEVIVVNIVDILKGNLSENIHIQKDDIIYVPRSFVGNVGYFIRQIAPFLDAAGTYYDIKRHYHRLRTKLYRTSDRGGGS